MIMYIFALRRNGFVIALYQGEQELPIEVVNHEFSTRQTKQILEQYGYTLQRYA